MKYLTRFLDPPKTQDSLGAPPTKPTKPPADPPKSGGHLEAPAYKTYETPSVVGPDLAERWGPGLTDDTPGIVIPRDWSWEVANWPQPLWVEWRAMSTEYLDGLDHAPTVDEIRAADHAAYCIVRPNVPAPEPEPLVQSAPVFWVRPEYIPPPFQYPEDRYPPGVEETGDTLEEALVMVENLKSMVCDDIDAAFGAAEAAHFPPHRWHEIAKRWH